MLERDWSRHVLALATRGGWQLRYHTHDSRHNSHGTVPGFPDWLFAHERKRVMLVAELKGDTGHGVKGATTEQDRWLMMFALAGIPAYVWTPADEAEVVDVLLGQRARRDRDMIRRRLQSG